MHDKRQHRIVLLVGDIELIFHRPQKGPLTEPNLLKAQPHQPLHKPHQPPNRQIIIKFITNTSTHRQQQNNILPIKSKTLPLKA
jgi:hypothetical protein